MPTDSKYSLPHVRFEHLVRSDRYTSPPRNMGPQRLRGDLATHRLRLARDFRAALDEAYSTFDATMEEAQDYVRGAYLEVRGGEGQPLSELDWPSKGIRLGAVRQLDEVEVGALYVPQASQEFLLGKLDEYATEDTTGDYPKPKNAAKLSVIEAVVAATLESLWTDNRPLPANPNEKFWCECWCWTGDYEAFLAGARPLNLRISPNLLRFPEFIVVPVFATRLEIEELLVRSSGAIEELRRADDSPKFFTKDAASDQNLWVEDLLQRVSFNDESNVTVCILDTGVARAHPLLEMAIRPGDCHAVVNEWGSDDHSTHGHGTGMAGLALYGDLTPLLIGTETLDLSHRVESVTLVAPLGFPQASPRNYGSITQAAVALPERTSPENLRTFCMAVTNEDVSGEVPTSWSSAVDQLCAGVAIGDESEDRQVELSRRLVFISAGNIPDDASPADAADPDEFPIEDPGQAWNALTVGAFTDRTDLAGTPGMAGWSAAVEAGDLSPYSRGSTDWNHSQCPIKPEIVFEGGNRALDPTGGDWVAGVDSLSILSTAKDFLRKPLDVFWATSAATAQAARMAAQIMSNDSSLWPESVRALMVHSAEWTPLMRQRLEAAPLKRDRINLVRQFGYGVPNLDRALASARNDLALVAQVSIKPFKARARDGRRGTMYDRPSFNEVHYYDLPWPKRALQEIEGNVRLKVTLSYYVEPSPGIDAAVTPAHYQSYGLRFDLKRPMETIADFQRYVNGAAEGGRVATRREQDDRWLLGVKSVAAGSLHCDVWEGPAEELAARDAIAIYPVGGWWRYRLALGRANSEARYGLVVSIESDDTEVDLYSEVEVAARVPVEVEV